jgi:hypothetical protein
MKCPGLVVAPPNYGLYERCSAAFMEILRETGRVMPLMLKIEDEDGQIRTIREIKVRSQEKKCMPGFPSLHMTARCLPGTRKYEHGSSIIRRKAGGY